MDKYLNPTELRELADFCDSLKPLWDRLVETRTALSFEAEVGPEFAVYDSNGDRLGTVMWCDEGAAFYPDTKEN